MAYFARGRPSLTEDMLSQQARVRFEDPAAAAKAAAEFKKFAVSLDFSGRSPVSSGI